MKPKYSIGLMNFCSHDPGCALIKYENKKIETIFAEEGFLSRKKKSYQFPLRSIKYCLDYFSISLNDIDVMMLDYMDQKRYFRTSDNYRLLIGDYIRSKLKIKKSKIRYVKSHHYAHALTAFWPSMLDEAAVLVIDGLGSEQQTHSVYYMNQNGKFKHIFEQKGSGIGELYTLITKSLGFEKGEEGKTMGLAPYGEKVSAKIINIPSLKGDYKGFTVDYSRILDRKPSSKLKISIKKLKNKKDLYKPYFSKLAFNLQRETEKCIVHLSKESLKKTGSKNLCFAGGVALNCVANNHVQNLKEVNNLWIQPASGDSGIPMGLALAGLEELNINLSKIMNRENRIKLSHPYSKDNNPISQYYEKKLNKLLKKNQVKLNSYSDQIIAKEISQKKIISLFTEGIEYGPRALGHRSFLADARTSKMKNIMNSKIKHREKYRPFAPIVLKEDFDKYFISQSNDHRYMLQAPLCKKKAIDEVPAICHIDKTARVQTAEKNIGKAYDILLSYRKLTNVSAIINTSFNDNNEPIVFTKLDALNSFLKCNADILVLEDFFIYRKEISNINNLRKEIELLQKKILQDYFKEALNELTIINRTPLNKQKNQLRDFIILNDKLSESYRFQRMLLKLINYLQKRDINRKMYLDNFHFRLIKDLINLFGLEEKEIFNNYKIIDDIYYNMKLISKNSDFILYNISAYFHNPFIINEFKNKNNIYSFYELNDKKLDLDFNNKKSKKISSKLINQIIYSYEHDRNLTINDFFNKINN